MGSLYYVKQTNIKKTGMKAFSHVEIRVSLLETIIVSRLLIESRAKRKLDLINDWCIHVWNCIIDTCK